MILSREKTIDVIGKRCIINTDKFPNKFGTIKDYIPKTKYFLIFLDEPYTTNRKTTSRFLKCELKNFKIIN